MIFVQTPFFPFESRQLPCMCTMRHMINNTLAGKLLLGYKKKKEKTSLSIFFLCRSSPHETSHLLLLFGSCPEVNVTHIFLSSFIVKDRTKLSLDVEAKKLLLIRFLHLFGPTNFYFMTYPKKMCLEESWKRDKNGMERRKKTGADMKIYTALRDAQNAIVVSFRFMRISSSYCCCFIDFPFPFPILSQHISTCSQQWRLRDTWV